MNKLHPMLTKAATILPLLGAGAYGIVFAADTRYVQQSNLAYILNLKEVREIQYKIDELEYTEDNERPLTKKEKWQQIRLQSQVDELKETK